VWEQRFGLFTVVCASNIMTDGCAAVWVEERKMGEFGKVTGAVFIL